MRLSATLLVGLALSCFSVSCENPDPTMEESVTLTDDKVEVLFTTAYTPADIDTVAARLARRGHTLDVKFTEYNSLDMLSGIGFAVRTAAGQQGAAQTRLLGTDQPFGLLIDNTTTPPRLVVGQFK